jgi:hypothetical protein
MLNPKGKSGKFGMQTFLGMGRDREDIPIFLQYCIRRNIGHTNSALDSAYRILITYDFSKGSFRMVYLCCPSVEDWERIIVRPDILQSQIMTIYPLL